MINERELQDTNLKAAISSNHQDLEFEVNHEAINNVQFTICLKVLRKRIEILEYLKIFFKTSLFSPLLLSPERNRKLARCQQVELMTHDVA
jgi:hypothetical protein